MEFKEQLEKAKEKLNKKLEGMAKVRVILDAYEEGWIDGWRANNKPFNIHIDTIIQDAVAYFANTCPHCQRELGFYVSLEEIQSWLEKQSYGDENE